jgi:hypothetical protein
MAGVGQHLDRLLIVVLHFLTGVLPAATPGRLLILRDYLGARPLRPRNKSAGWM